MTSGNDKHKGEDFGALAASRTTDPSFGAAFKADPVRALAAKGIVLNPKEELRVKQQVADAVRGGGGLAAETEVTVSVGVKF